MKWTKMSFPFRVWLDACKIHPGNHRRSKVQHRISYLGISYHLASKVLILNLIIICYSFWQGGGRVPIQIARAYRTHKEMNSKLLWTMDCPWPRPATRLLIIKSSLTCLSQRGGELRGILQQQWLSAWKQLINTRHRFRDLSGPVSSEANCCQDRLWLPCGRSTSLGHVPLF